MTTQLKDVMARMISIEGQDYKVVLSHDGITLTPKGRRQRDPIAWPTLIALGERQGAPTSPVKREGSAIPHSVVAHVIEDVSAAGAAITRVRERLQQAVDLPPDLRAEIEPDPVYGSPEQRADWFIEPLLTPTEVAALLRISTAAVRALPIPSIVIAGEPRYRQSALRDYLRSNEQEPATRRFR